MRRIEKTIKGEQIIIEQFNSFDDLLHTCDKRKYNFGYGRDNLGGSWAGCNSYEEARKLLTHGWSEKIELMKKSIKELSLGTADKISFKNDVVGYAPIVPNAILGLPQSMINNVRKPKKAKVVNIQISMDFNSGVNQDEIIKWGSNLVNKIINLENSGFRVKLEYIGSFQRDDSESGIHICRIPLKNEFQPLDLKRIMFPLCHSAMLRIIMFDWYERLPKAKRLSGYGRALYSMSSSRAEFIISQINDSSSYFLKFRDNIDKAFKEVR